MAMVKVTKQEFFASLREANATGQDPMPMATETYFEGDNKRYARSVWRDQRTRALFGQTTSDTYAAALTVYELERPSIN